MNIHDIAKQIRSFADELEAAKPEQPKPFTLPTPPPGMRWHREDGWTEGDLPPGMRPLVEGEEVSLGDETEAYSSGWQQCRASIGRVAGVSKLIYRTRRPLLFTHSGHEWTWHRAGGSCPCDGEKMVYVLFHDGEIRGMHTAKFLGWGDNAQWKIIGWRYADAPLPIQTLAQDQVELSREMQEAASQVLKEELQKPDPYAEWKKAHAEGKVIQWKFKDADGWMDKLANFNEYPENCDYRIKPDEIPWTEWHGGECPLKDEEVEEWEATCRNGVTVIRSSPPSAMAAYWSHDQHAADIIAYRVLKTREPKPKVPLGPEDILPGSIFILPTRKPSTWHAVTGVYEDCVQLDHGDFPFDELMEDGWLINRSIPQTGKWNPEAWEACER